MISVVCQAILTVVNNILLCWWNINEDTSDQLYEVEYNFWGKHESNFANVATRLKIGTSTARIDKVPNRVFQTINYRV